MILQQIGKGRLIDADALLDKTVRRNSVWNSITNSEGKNLEEMILEMPSVEVLDKIMDEVCDIDDEIVLNPDSVFERKAYVRLSKVMDIIDKYKAETV